MRARSVIAALSVSVLFFVIPAPAHAVTSGQKLTLATSWTQPTSASQSTWNSARQNQGKWAEYSFDWSTDFCSASPDKPLGFDFRLSCHRHDFGYRNFKKLNAFPANKARLDNAFHADLKALCAKYSAVPKKSCLALAWTYYQAVKKFGALKVTAGDVRLVEARQAP
jgi:hypothetical protein